MAETKTVLRCFDIPGVGRACLLPDLRRVAGVSRQALNDLVQRGKLQSVSHVGRKMVPETAATAYLEQRQRRQTARAAPKPPAANKTGRGRRQRRKAPKK